MFRLSPFLILGWRCPVSLRVLSSARSHHLSLEYRCGIETRNYQSLTRGSENKRKTKKENSRERIEQEGSHKGGRRRGKSRRRYGARPSQPSKTGAVHVLSTAVAELLPCCIQLYHSMFGVQLLSSHMAVNRSIPEADDGKPSCWIGTSWIDAFHFDACALGRDTLVSDVWKVMNFRPCLLQYFLRRRRIKRKGMAGRGMWRRDM